MARRHGPARPRVVLLTRGRAAACGTVLRTLPAWFGIPAAIRRYERDADRLPMLAVRQERTVVGFLTLKRIPPASLAKVVRQLARAGLVRARGGRLGGIRLARPAADMNLLSVIEAVEGSSARVHCLYEPARDCLGPECPVFCPVRGTEERAREDLAATSLAHLASFLALHPDRLAARSGAA